MDFDDDDIDIGVDADADGDGDGIDEVEEEDSPQPSDNDASDLESEHGGGLGEGEMCWRDVKPKVVKDNMVRTYAMRMHNKYKLSKRQAQHLSELLNTFIVLKIIPSTDIIVELGEIVDVRNLQLVEGDFHLDLQPVEDRESMLEILAPRRRASAPVALHGKREQSLCALVRKHFVASHKQNL